MLYNTVQVITDASRMSRVIGGSDSYDDVAVGTNDNELVFACCWAA